MRLDCRRTQRKILCTLHDGRRKFFEVDGVIDFEGNFSENFSGGIDDFDFIFVGNKKILIPKREVLERFIGRLLLKPRFSKRGGKNINTRKAYTIMYEDRYIFDGRG